MRFFSELKLIKKNYTYVNASKIKEPFFQRTFSKRKNKQNTFYDKKEDDRKIKSILVNLFQRPMKRSKNEDIKLLTLEIGGFYNIITSFKWSK